MQSEEWQNVEALLDAALELAPAARRALLDERCAGMPELRREVESLLGCEEQVDGFLAASALAFAADFFAADAAADARAGQTVGHYRIIREIGRGGMGAVFLAERADGEFQQQVALKIVRRSFADAELARRFRRERQILASLSHDNIARLLDGGVSNDGEPFLAMEYIAGLRIDDYCAAQQLQLVGRLRLFLDVCRGVAYAHQHLVVHRDIKPSNIIVNDEGEPKLLDFGIAKLLDAEHADEHTQTNFRAFTPEYAAPEQVRGGQVTTASDVYSLGVLLNELLQGAPAATNRQPAHDGWRSERGRRKTAETNLPTQQANGNGRARNRKQNIIDGELKNIIAMARREEPARRYASVAQFAEDIQRYLDGQPVRAQQDSFTYRAEKFVRRNKLTVGAAALVLLSLIAGLAIALWQANIALVERDRAERRFTDVRQLSNALLTDIAPKIERLQGATEARRAVVRQSLKYLDSLASESVDDLSLQAELAAAYKKVGDLQGNPAKPNLSDFVGAQLSYEKANAIRQTLPDTFENQMLLAENFRELGNVRFAQNDVKGSLGDFAEALRIYENLLATGGESFELQTAYLEAQIELGETYSNNNRFGEAVPILRRTIAALERLDPNHRETQRLLARSYSQLGNALSWDDKQPEAERAMAKAVVIAESLVAQYPNDTALLGGVWRTFILASSIYEDTNYEMSLQFAQKALKTAEKAVAADTADMQARHNQAKSFSRVGIVSALLKRLPEAVANLEQAEKIFLELVANEPENRGYQHDLGTLYTRFGDAKQRQGDLPGALRAFQKSADYYEMSFQADDKNTLDRRNLAQSLKSAGDVYLRLSEKEKAKDTFQRALEILNLLKARNALGEFDKKLFGAVQAGLQTAKKTSGKIN